MADSSTPAAPEADTLPPISTETHNESHEATQVVPQTTSELSKSQTSDLSNTRRKKRQRSTPLAFLTSPDYSRTHDGPDITHFRQLLAALMLTTALSVLSALDAERHCLEHEIYALLDLVDDDNFQNMYDRVVFNEGEQCIGIFQNVILPTGVATAVIGGLALYVLHRHSRLYLKRRTFPSAIDCYHFALRIVALNLCLLAAHMYNLGMIMLATRYQDESDNPYQSLAAVDRYGHVGDNANLYYMTWISAGLCLALSYQSMTAAVRTSVHARDQALHQGLLPATSWQLRADDPHESRNMWFQSLYRLRVRSGIWVAAFLSSLVIIISSRNVWVQVFGSSVSYLGNPRMEVCRTLSAQGRLPTQLCHRTVAAWTIGLVASILCSIAITLHWCSRLVTPGDRHLSELVGLPLRAEIGLSLLLSVFLGLNAVWSTAVQGPAAPVGNLYYASWLSFLLCVRICLGCVEEYYNISEKGKDVDRGYRAPQGAHSPIADKATSTDELQLSASNSSAGSLHDPFEKDRQKHLRSYLFIGVFSTVCAASAYDAASNQSAALSLAQKYMIVAPFIVTCIAGTLFLLCLSGACYVLVSHFCIGGIMSIIVFLLWFVNLVLTMHSGDSWAVNGIGEIRNANLYYFSWASILSAGLQMASYMKALVGIAEEDIMSVVWAAICKVCFVILGAALHVWHTIADNCDFEEITNGAYTYCSRTTLALAVALTGMLVGGLVVTARVLLILCPGLQCSRVQAHIEMIVSVFLMFLFGTAVAMITGIGGPGQSVGDLYYSTWLAFWVSLGIFLACYAQIKREDVEVDEQEESLEVVPTPKDSVIV